MAVEEEEDKPNNPSENSCRGSCRKSREEDDNSDGYALEEESDDERRRKSREGLCRGFCAARPTADGRGGGGNELGENTIVVDCDLFAEVYKV